MADQTESNPSEPDWTSPQYCPYCGSDNLEDRSKDWEQRDTDSILDSEKQEYRIHGGNVCIDCGGRFETVSEPKEYTPTHATFTLQFVPENPTEDEAVTNMQAIKLIEGGEEDPAVVSERAKWNMMFGGCGEIQGPEYAIRDLYEFISEQADIDAEEEEFQAGKWLFESEESE